MKQYEYKTISTDAKGFLGGKVDIESFEAQLNELGAQGWELVETLASNQDFGSTRYIVSIFKRERKM